MKVIPKLNLNKHPYEVDNCSLIDATNLIISNDNAVLQTEPERDISDVSIKLNKLISNDVIFNIKYIIPCNKELVIFVYRNTDPDAISIYRYNEELKELKYVTRSDYNNGILLGTFTYNIDNLIIAYSEYFEDDSKKIPLKTINLGKFNSSELDDELQLKDKSLHSICPEVKIPTIKASYNYGIAYKGWYHIFIRYKISNNTYTQWFNTNESIFVDNFNEAPFVNYWVSKDAPKGEQGNNDVNSIATVITSDDKDVTSISFKCTIINNKDTKFKYYQLGFICMTKSYSKAYKTNDIFIENDTFLFSSSQVESYNINDIITTYTNYYNTKSLTTIGNRLYIGNYKENNIENEVITKLKDINLDINFIENNSKINEGGSNIVTKITITAINKDNSVTINGKKWQNSDTGFIYFLGTTLTTYSEFYGQDTKYPNIELSSFSPNDILTIEYRAKDNIIKTIEIAAKDIIIAPFEKLSDLYGGLTGIIYFNIDGKLVDDISIQSYGGVNDDEGYKHQPRITLVNGNFINKENSKVYIDCNDTFRGTNFTYKEDVELNTEETTITTLNTCGIYPNQPYNFFIHFIDKYGVISKGFNINEFNINCKEKQYINTLNNTIIFSPKLEDNSKYLTAEFKLSNIPDGYIGYFISYEQFEKSIKYNCVSYNSEDTKVNELNLYTDELNYSDTIDLNFDKIRIYTKTKLKKGSNTTSRKELYILYTKNKEYIDLDILSKKIYVADSYNNISKSTRLTITVNNDKEIDFNDKLCELFNSSKDNYYNKETKTLIPCSVINYDYNNITEVNTKNSFLSKHHAIIYYDGIFYNEGLKIFQKVKSENAVVRPFRNAVWFDFIEIPNESLQYNNKPVTTFFPIKGLDTTDEKLKTFEIGNIVESKNTIDLFQQKNVAVYDNYPKSLDWYNRNVSNSNDFPKTIRRSNIIQDESHTNSWRNFELEQYKNITENKGNIVKLIAIGYYFIVHTEHSMFLFNATDTIKSNENGIQLSSIDIWDVQYKEIVTSNLGFAGIQKEYSGIIGEFGYVFYDKDAKHIYRYDNGQVGYIDKDITNFLNKLDEYDVNIVDDKKHDRLLFNFTKDNADSIILSYNYKTNTFVSRHIYDFYRGYSTKENTYLINKFIENERHNDILCYSKDKYENSTCNIIINTSYPIMKFIEHFTYKISYVVEKVFNTYLPVEEKDMYYSGNSLRVYSENCDTGELDITVYKENINKVSDYTKPYWDKGNWNVSFLRDKLNDYINNAVKAEDSSRIYGNWFVIKFSFNQHKQIEIETIDVTLNNI